MESQEYTNLTFRLEARKKQDFEALSKRMGMTMNTAFNMFVTAMLHTGRLPFEVVDPLEDPVIGKQIRDELKRRLEKASDPNTKWYTTEEVKERLGLK